MAYVIILENNKYIITDSETAENRNLQVVYTNPGMDSAALIYLENGLYIMHNDEAYKESNRAYLFVYADHYIVDCQNASSISDICHLANKYNTISMIDVVEHVIERVNKQAETRAEKELNTCNQEILELSEQIKELKEITTSQFRNTNAKIGKRR
ncbi:MAG: hypothetical protein WBG43_03395 [Marinifilaceae bacterium]